MRTRFLAPLIFIAACQPSRSVKAWIQSRDAEGRIVAGATVEVDGQPIGLTDQRGLYRLKIARKSGDRVRLAVYRERPGAGEAPSTPIAEWRTVFTVGTDGLPTGSQAGWLTAVLLPVAGSVPCPTPSPASLPFGSPSPATCSKDADCP